MSQWRPNFKIGGKLECLIGLKDKKGTGFGKGFFELNGKLYGVSISRSQKEGVTDWVRLTEYGSAGRGGSTRGSSRGGQGYGGNGYGQGRY